MRKAIISAFVLKSIIFSKVDFKKISEIVNQDNATTKLSDYNAWAINYSKRVFDQQLFNSQFVFFLVMGVTFFGIGLCSAQFWMEYKNSKDKQTDTKIKISRDGLEISSSITGIIILIISLIFFYIYLIYIYPIKFIEPIHK